jgi:hypothetical protein
MFNRQSSAQLADQIVQRSNRTPEFWLFNPPATAKDIKRLETQLGWPLPEPMAEALARFNGGFASIEGKVGIESAQEISAARAAANRFMSCLEIDGVYRRLLGSHPDEDPLAFPFIPFMRLADGGFLVVNANDPAGAVWNAWTLEGPHVWKRLYPNFAALLFDYLGRDGALLEEPYEDEPMAMAAAY